MKLKIVYNVKSRKLGINMKPQAQINTGSISINRVLTNTYALLGMTILFSALTATLAMITEVPPINPFITLIGFYGLLFLIHKNASSSLGILFTFAFTGFIGITTAPLLNAVLATTQGSAVIVTALAATGTIFVGLSAYTISTKQDFSYLAGFLMIGILGGFVVSLLGFFMQMPLMMLGSAGIFVLISSGLILFHTSNIIHGGERNYILATVSLYVALYNLFINLLFILQAFSGNNRD